MTKCEPEVTDSSRYELRETASILGVSTSTINKWTKTGRLKQGGVRKANRRRFWTGADIIKCWRACM